MSKVISYNLNIFITFMPLKFSVVWKKTSYLIQVPGYKDRDAVANRDTMSIYKPLP